MKVGFIGLGNMGAAMAQNLLSAGHELVVYNRTIGRAEGLRKNGAAVAESPAGVARAVDVLITMLADDQAVQEVIFGDDAGGGALDALRKGAVHVSMSTISVELSGRLNAVHELAGQRYVAAPVFGRPEAAQTAGLWIVAAGHLESVELCRPLFEKMGRGLSVLGDNPESANAVKVTGNFMIAALLETLGEAFALIRKRGIDTGEFLNIVNALFRSPVYETYGKIIAEQRYEPAGFRAKLGLKDVRLTLAAADKSEVPMPLGSLVHDRLLSAIGHGRGDMDWSVIAALSAEDAGV
jgi:3-hydroxyisobutyrate dehydrogenase-like beta-hydroxyacid dehydrogenase